MKLGVYVGSFNPVHLGHIKVVNYLLNKKLVDKVLILPTPNYWHKQDLVELKHRLAMLKFFEDNNIIIDDKNCIYQYTYELLNHLNEDYPTDELYLVIGADNLKDLKRWKNAEEVLKHKIIVLPRGDIDINLELKEYNKDNFVVAKDFDYLDVSSTEVRNGNTDNMDVRVLKYIKDNKLYTR